MLLQSFILGRIRALRTHLPKVHLSNQKEVTVVAAKPSRDSVLGLGLTKKEGELDILVSYIAPDGAFAGTELKVGMRVEAVNGLQFKTCSHIGEYLKTAKGQVVIEASMQSKSKSSESPAPKRMRKPTLASETTRAILGASYESEYWRRYVPMAQALDEASRLWSKEGKQTDSFRTAVGMCLSLGCTQSMIVRHIYYQVAYAEPTTVTNNKLYYKVFDAVRYAKKKVWGKPEVEEPEELDDSPSYALAMASQTISARGPRHRGKQVFPEKHWTVTRRTSIQTQHQGRSRFCLLCVVCLLDWCWCVVIVSFDNWCVMASAVRMRVLQSSQLKVLSAVYIK